MDFLNANWLWLYLGGFLMLAELVMPGFVIFFFGLAAATVGLVLFPFSELSLTVQLALFSALSILYLVTLRRFVKNVFMGDTAESRRIENEHVGRVAKVVSEIRPNRPGRILLGDAEWNARAEAPIAVGADVRIVAQDNLTFAVEALS